VIFVNENLLHEQQSFLWQAVYYSFLLLHDVSHLESSSNFFGEGKKTELFRMLTVTVLCSYGSVNGNISPSTISQIGIRGGEEKEGERS
jgi:hypothetical protein